MSNQDDTGMTVELLYKNQSISVVQDRSTSSHEDLIYYLSSKPLSLMARNTDLDPDDLQIRIRRYPKSISRTDTLRFEPHLNGVRYKEATIKSDVLDRIFKLEEIPSNGEDSADSDDESDDDELKQIPIAVRTADETLVLKIYREDVRPPLSQTICMAHYNGALPSFGDAGEDPALQLAGKGGESQKTSPPWRTYTYHLSSTLPSYPMMRKSEMQGIERTNPTSHRPNQAPPKPLTEPLPSWASMPLQPKAGDLSLDQDLSIPIFNSQPAVSGPSTTTTVIPQEPFVSSPVKVITPIITVETDLPIPPADPRIHRDDGESPINLPLLPQLSAPPSSSTAPERLIQSSTPADEPQTKPETDVMSQQIAITPIVIEDGIPLLDANLDAVIANLGVIADQNAAASAGLNNIALSGFGEANINLVGAPEITEIISGIPAILEDLPEIPISDVDMAMIDALFEGGQLNSSSPLPPNRSQWRESPTVSDLRSVRPGSSDREPTAAPAAIRLARLESLGLTPLSQMPIPVVEPSCSPILFENGKRYINGREDRSAIKVHIPLSPQKQSPASCLGSKHTSRSATSKHDEVRGCASTQRKSEKSGPPDTESRGERRVSSHRDRLYTRHTSSIPTVETSHRSPALPTPSTSSKKRTERSDEIFPMWNNPHHHRSRPKQHHPIHRDTRDTMKTEHPSNSSHRVPISTTHNHHERSRPSTNPISGHDLDLIDTIPRKRHRPAGEQIRDHRGRPLPAPATSSITKTHKSSQGRDSAVLRAPMKYETSGNGRKDREWRDDPSRKRDRDWPVPSNSAVKRGRSDLVRIAHGKGDVIDLTGDSD